ncbi:hypothetical protein [Radiobacillus deserti]|uniref:hypothetical protein n=1 Tax=Radiobacillus deserti TaxID=2594883 RepID=UPI001315222A|nr:hypothetical protein [Radiobacillus deserti]
MEALFSFFIPFTTCFVISAFLNIMFKTTRKKDWVISLLLSIGISIIALPIMIG